MDKSLLEKELYRDEGFKPQVYKDSLGYWTIGIGRLVDPSKPGSGLTLEEALYLLGQDIDRKVDQLVGKPYWDAVKDDPVRSRALVNMAFQLGVNGVTNFKNSMAYIAKKDWANAGKNMRLSAWYRQTPARAERVIKMIETGVA